MVFELDAHRLELIPDAVGFLEVFCLASSVTLIDEPLDL